MTALQDVQRFWSARAAQFDDEPDHGLAAPYVRDAWRDLLRQALPGAQRRVLDLGCGTGSLSLLIAEAGHRVTGIDLSRQMVQLADQKLVASGQRANFIVGDAADPPFAPGTFDVVLCRHLLWTLPDPQAALARWQRVLRPSGTLVAIEGRWAAPDAPRHAELPWDGGVSANVLMVVLEPLFHHVQQLPLSARDDLWGKRVTDERYAVIATRPRSIGY